MIEVINRKNYHKNDYVYVGRPSPLGNPFTHVPSKHADIRVATRAEAVEKYRGWLQKALEDDPLVHKAFMHLVDFYVDFGTLKLGCWCHPKECHAHVLAEMIEKAAENARKTLQEHPQQG